MPAKDMERRRIRQREYRQTPEYKEQRREYMVAYRQTSVYKEYDRERKRSPKYKESQRVYRQRPEFKEYLRKYQRMWSKSHPRKSGKSMDADSP